MFFMFLDVICWAPEVFFLFSLCLLIWYGSGSLVSPVAERICFLNLPHTNVFCIESMDTNKSTVLNVDPYYTAQKENKGKMFSPIAGPLQLSGHLNTWAITVCLLMALLIWEAPFQSLQAGGLFLRDLFVSEL
jgi:hypothetical protein